MYKPNPLDTSDIDLPKVLKPIIEELAENVHENWAALRMSEGWIYGEQHDDRCKQTPYLVPYSKLPDDEREYDRKTATETIKFILSKGYRII
ncbi:MAG: RyR domain-containing protein [Clostridia bacterium]|nr:RyR domain-containing protein [Clostridia bacterium]